MSAASIVLVLGAGPRVGTAIAQRFAGDGYKVAVASRSGTGVKEVAGVLALKADFANPDSIPALFDAVKAEFGNPPNVVIYNAPAMTPPPEKDAALSIPVESVAKDLNVNTVSAYMAAQQAVKGWITLPKESQKLFIYTGNVLNEMIIPMPVMMDLGMGKSASAYWIGLADMTYSAQGYRFFYADERNAEGKMKGMTLDGPAHADFFAQLATGEHKVPWHATFVKDKGYVKF